MFALGCTQLIKVDAFCVLNPYLFFAPQPHLHLPEKRFNHQLVFQQMKSVNFILV